MPAPSSSDRLPRSTFRPSTGPADALARHRFELRARGEDEPAGARARHDRGRERVLAALLEGRREPQQVGLLPARRGLDRGQCGPALGQGARLVDDQGVHLLEGLEGLRVADQHSKAGAPAHAHHDRHGSGEAQGARARDDEDAHRRHQPVGQARLGTHQRPHHEARRRDRDDRGHEVRRHPVRQSLDGRPAPLRLTDHADDLREEGVRTDTFGADHQRPGAVQGCADHAVAHALFHGHRLPAHHRLVHRAATIDHHTVDRDLLTRADAQAVVGLHAVEGDVRLAPVGGDEPRGLGRHTQQGPQGAARPAARAQLEDLTQQDERRDHGRGFEVAADLAVVAAERRRERAGARGRPRRCSRRRVPVPMPISVNMFRLRLLNEAHMRSKNGHPPHRTTGVARPSSTKARARGEIQAIAP